MMRRIHRKAKAGIFGVGLAAYWRQFPGLRETLFSYQKEIERHIGEFNVEVVSGGFIDDEAAAFAAGDFFRREGIDFLICYPATYATSSQVLPVVQESKCPVLVLNLQPVAALDYRKVDTRIFLENCGSCPVPEICCAFTRSGIEFNVVTGVLKNDSHAWREIREWCEAASVARNLNGGRFGFMGHVYPGMLDMYSDFTAIHAQMKAHVEILEMCDLEKRVAAASAVDVEVKLDELRRMFIIGDESVRDEVVRKPSEQDLQWSAQVACGLDSLVRDFRLDALTYYYRGLDGNLYEKLGAGMILGNSLLTASGVPTAGEGDIKTCIGMLVMECLGAGGSFTEFIAMDFKENFILMGHDGPAHIAISDRKPVVRGLNLYHGKRGFGCSVEFSVRTGPVTLLGVTQDKESKLKFIVAEGECISGPVSNFGNTNSRIKFPLSTADFMNRWCGEGPTHHLALGIGHVAGKLKKLARILELEMKMVTEEKTNQALNNF